MTPHGGIPTVQIFLKHWEKCAFKASPTCLDTPMNKQFRSQALTHKSGKKHHESQKKTNCTKGHFRKSCWHSGISFCILASSTPSWHLLFLSLTSLPEECSSHYEQFLLTISVTLYPHTCLTRVSCKPSPEIINSLRIFSSLTFCNVPVRHSSDRSRASLRQAIVIVLYTQRFQS